MQMELGARIRSLRKARRMTQEQMSDMLGISRQRYARIENGTGRATLDLLTRIAEALDITVRDITNVLEEEPVVAYRAGESRMASDEIFEMLDLFYANRHLRRRIEDQSQV